MTLALIICAVSLAIGAWAATPPKRKPPPPTIPWAAKREAYQRAMRAHRGQAAAAKALQDATHAKLKETL